MNISYDRYLAIVILGGYLLLHRNVAVFPELFVQQNLINET